MAGNYPDVPGHRMAYDRDGSIACIVNTSAGAVASLTSGQIAALNDEDSDAVGIDPSARGLCVIFPELRDVVGYAGTFSTVDGVVAGTVYTSTNTTNGFDGTWVSRGTWVATTLGAGLRTGVQTVSWPGVKAVRFHGSGGSFSQTWNMQALHLFGSPSAGEAPNRLRFWHPIFDAEVGGAYFDWGNVPRLSVADRQFRIKNNSSAMIASTVTVGIEALTDASPAVVGWHAFSINGGPFSASLMIPTLNPGQLSDVITVRRSPPSDAALGLWWQRITATAAVWS